MTAMHDFPPFTRVKPCRYGMMAYNVHDRYVGRSLDLYGEFSEGEAEMFRRLVRPGDAVLDAGANVGAHTLLFARLVGPSGAVWALEPQRVVFQALCANMALNSVTNARCLPVAAGPGPGEAALPAVDYARPGNFGGLSVGGGRGERVPVVAIDSLGLPRCRLIKLDVEGAEEGALRGAAGTIARDRPVLYVENDREEKSAGLVRFVASLGYEMYWHRPPLYNPANFAGNPTNVFGRLVSINMVCLPRDGGWRVGGLPPVAVPAG